MTCTLWIGPPRTSALHTDLKQDTHENARHREQGQVLDEPGEPQGSIADADGPQDLLEPELLLQDQAFDHHADRVHERQHQEHGEDASDALDEAGCRGRWIEEVRKQPAGGCVCVCGRGEIDWPAFDMEKMQQDGT